MASIRKKGSGYEAAVARKGVRKSAMFSTKLEAQMWAAEIEKKIIQGGFSGGQYKTVGDLLQRYVSTVSVKKRGADKERIRVARLCRDDIEGIKLGELSASTWLNGAIGDCRKCPTQPCSVTGICSRMRLISPSMNGAGLRKIH